ncbi:MAG: hypothetical protein R6U36_10570 [Candidatus Fermentibacteraceae bacterium]
MMLILALLAFPWPVEGTGDLHAIELIPFGEGIAATGHAGSRLLVLDGELRPALDLTAEELGVDWFRSIAADPAEGDLWVLAEDAGPFLFGFDRETLEDTGGYRAVQISNPVVDGSGRLWFSSDGNLYRDFVDIGLPVCTNGLAVSADGEQLAWVDGEDRVWSAKVSDFEPEVVEERRSMAPFYLPTSPVLVVPLLEGGFAMHMPDGTALEIEEGMQPSWCPVPEGVVYCISRDDGHNITESDIYLAAITGEVLRLTETPEALETNPSVYDEGLVAVDAANGCLVVVPDDCLPRASGYRAPAPAHAGSFAQELSLLLDALLSPRNPGSPCRPVL